jgi:hypothetical protein
MQSDLTESVQASIRPGEMTDTYYYGESNLCKQAYPSVVNTRFVQQFTNLGAGSSQFIISPQQGVSDIILQLQLPVVGASGFTSATGLSLSAGWGYGLINRISVRYGSSAQYFWSGAQVLLQNLLDAENSTKANDILNLGGNFLNPTNLGAATSTTPLSAYVYLKLPHNSVRADGKPLPFASDLLVQPIVVTVEMLPTNSVFIAQVGSGGNVSTAPTSLAAAQMQVKQEMLTDTSDLLARRVDMNSHAYTFPLMYFCQQETQIPLVAQATSQSVNLTGFRAGEVKQIVLWLTLNSEQIPGNGSYNPNRWYPLGSITLTYNGEIFSRFDAGSSQLWNLTADTKSQVVSVISANPGGAAGASTTALSYWFSCPFAQVDIASDKDMKLLHGKPILNAVVNLTLTTPDASAYTLHAMYLYNASLLCSRGSAEYIF